MDNTHSVYFKMNSCDANFNASNLLCNQLVNEGFDIRVFQPEKKNSVAEDRLKAPELIPRPF